jgi:dTMP kinase
MEKLRGKLIVIEGADRSGKSTLVNGLKDKYQDALVSNFPNRSTPIGQIINSYLKGTQSINAHAVHLLFSANRHEAELEMILREGRDIILDRYVASGVAYSMAKGLDDAWCMESDKGLPKPDLVIWLRLPPEEAAKRGDYGQERYEKLEFQTKVDKAFSKLEDKTWLVLDATCSKKELVDTAINAIEQIKPGPLKFY